MALKLAIFGTTMVKSSSALAGLLIGSIAD
jgi:hypothetical protein